ncbi:MAG: SdrD B-like domain-containing protein [Gemmatimonadota bacterium]|nr:SdrD B-like domain-containing protein [Gemmatimonadota bacterium]
MTKIFPRGMSVLGTVLLAGLACSEIGDSNPIAPAALTGSPTPVKGELTVCKIGSDASFSLTVNGVSQGGFGLTDGQCALVYSSLANPANNVTVTELPSGATLDSIVGVGIRGAQNDPTGTISQITILGTNAAAVKVGLEIGVVLTFYNTAPPPPPTGEIGDFVWNDANANGIQDAGELGIPGLTVTLSGAASATTTTGPAGDYLFTGLTAGSYTVTVATPAGYTASPTGAGTPATDNNGSPASVTLPTNSSSDLTIDFGFFVPAPPVGGEGCTPGYWKQSQHFNNWTAPYTPSTQFSAVFENAYPGKTLLQVLNNNGNTTGLDALGRHTVAALLDAASSGVNYDLTVAQVISQFNAVYPGTKTAYIAQKDIFEAYNQQGCPLN